MGRRLRAWTAFFLLFPAAGAARAQSEAAPAAQQVVGQPVVAVRVVSDAGEVLAQDPADLPLRSGQSFALDTERDSLRQLFRTGEYADVVAQAAQVSGGVRLDFVVRRNFYVNQVHVEGLHEPPSDAVAASALHLNFGEIFREADMPMALDRLRQTLQDEGFYQPKLTYMLSPQAATRQMDITVQVDPGTRARVGAITLTNQTPFPEADLRGRLKLKPGTEITSQRLSSGSEKVRKWLVDRHYLGARTSIERGSYDPKSNQVPLHVTLYAGSEIQVRVAGVKLSNRTQRRLLPVYEEGAVDEDLLQEGRRNLRDYLQGAGYFDADVSYTISPQPPAPGSSTEPATQPPAGPETINYAVERGSRHRLAGVSFDGNRYFGDELLRSRLQMQPAAFASRGRYSQALLAADAESLAGIYQANGFLQVRVTNEVVNPYEGKAENLFVRFHIAEGLQTRVAELTIDGNHALDNSAISAVIGSSAGQPYSDFNVAGDRDNVLAMYYDHGFPEARFTSATEDVVVPEGAAPRCAWPITSRKARRNSFRTSW